MTKPHRFLRHLVSIQSNKPLFLGGVIFLSLLIIISTSVLFILAVKKPKLSSETATQVVRNAFAKLISQELEASLEKEFLPADGKSTVVLSASLNTGGPAEAKEMLPSLEVEVLEGDLTLLKKEEKELFTLYTFQAGTKPGRAKLEIKAGLLKKTLSLALFDPTPPSPPTIEAPQNESVLGNTRPSVAGSAQAHSTITLFIDAFENGRAETDDKGLFSVTPETPLKNGPHLIRLVAENRYGIKSLPSESIKITIDTQALEVDLDNLRLEPNPVSRGEMVNLFVPASLETSELFVILSNTQYELKNRYQSSVFSGRIIAPKTPGNYPLTLLAYDKAKNTTFFSNVATLNVT